MYTAVRNAQPVDIPTILDLADQKRQQYETYQPIFWRIAPAARETQHPYLTQLIKRDTTIALVYETDEIIEGFIIATLIPSPPVYDPGGTTCSIDDFYVPASLWETAGQALLTKVMQQARQRGAAQTVVVCGHLDQPKREFLARLSFTIASEWYVLPLK